jgi:hypothetical protein
MRRFRTTAGVLVALFAFTATPALAKEFTTSRLPKECSEELPCKTKGIGIGSADEAHPEFTQKFKFGGFTILCKKATTKAKTPAEGAPDQVPLARQRVRGNRLRRNVVRSRSRQRNHDVHDLRESLQDRLARPDGPCGRRKKT